MNKPAAWLHAGPAFDGTERRLILELHRAGAPALIVTPAARKQRQVRALVGEDGPVRVVTMAELLQGPEAAAQVPGSVVRALTAEAMRPGGGLADVGRFPGVARRVADLIATLKRYGYATPGQFAQGLARVRGRARPPARDRQLVDAFEAYQLILAGRHDPADRALAAVESLERGSPELPARILVLGFHDLDQVQGRAVRALADRASQLDLVCDEETGLAAPATQAARGLVGWASQWMRRAAPGPLDDPPGRADRRRIAVALFERVGTLDDPGGVELIEADDSLAEVTALARSLGERRAWDDGRRVAVVFPDLARYAPLVREVFPRFGVPYDLAHGAPLLETPVGRSAMAALQFVADGMPRRGLYDLATAPFLRVRSRGGDLWAGWLDGHAREAGVVGGLGRPEQEWIEPLQQRIAWLAATPDRAEDAEMLARQVTVLRALFRSLTPLRRKSDAGALAGGVAQALEGLGLFSRAGVPKEGVPDEVVREERAALSALEESLAQTPLALAGAGRIGLGRLVAALRADWGGRAVRVPGDPGGVRVLGRLEPRSLEFDELHLGGLSADRFPGSAVTGGGVLSERDRAALGLPAADKRTDEARHLVYRALLAPTDRLSLSWPAREGANPLQPADLVVDLLTLLGRSPARSPATPVGPVAEALVAQGRGVGGAAAEHPGAARGIAMEALRAGEGPLTRWEGRLGSVAGLAQRLGPTEHVFSPSQLEAALRCPFAWFSERVLRLDRAEEDDDDDALPAVWGDLIHRILARWALDRAPAEAPAARMRRAVQATLAEPPWRDLKGPFWEVQRDNLERGLLRRFLEVESAGGRTPTHAELRFGPVSGEARDIEDPRSTETPLTLGQGDRAVRVAGKVDRVDAGDGWVFDYKTGRPPSIAQVGRGGAVQLPLYLLALRRELGLSVDRATWYRLRPESVGPSGRSWPPRGVDIGAALAEVEDDIVERIGALRRGEMTMVPKGTRACPPRCAYSRICRVQDRRIAVARASQA